MNLLQTTITIAGIILLFEQILMTGNLIVKNKRLEQEKIILKIKYKVINEDKRKWKYII
tara:strand:- start:4 stop:180 length:177 start_codon:yes stop_codon:yes gene_type:complete